LIKDEKGEFSQEYLEVLEGYSILLFGILGVEETDLN
jgi:hypothetical protein